MGRNDRREDEGGLGVSGKPGGNELGMRDAHKLTD